MAGEIQLGGVTLATESGGTISLSGNVDTLTPTKTALNASGSAPIYACRAWVNFNGTGTVAIRASGNVSSITDNGTGDYTVNFTNTMVDANYVTVVSAGLGGNTRNLAGLVGNSGHTVSATRVRGLETTGAVDMDLMCVSIFR